MVEPQGGGQGEDSADWILYANKVVGISASAIQWGYFVFATHASGFR